MALRSVYKKTGIVDDPVSFDTYLQEFAREWAEENDKIFCKTETTMFSDFDRRLLAFTFGKTTDPDQGCILDTVWDKYFDSR